MSLLNYSTSIEVGKTLAEIQKCLTAHGASAVLTEFDDEGSILALSFKINLNGKEMAFRLPTDWRPVLEILKRDPKVPRSKETQPQSLRVAWRITKDWVEAQMAIVETKMVTLPQVFLPYAVTKNGRTVYEKILDGGEDSIKLLSWDMPICPSCNLPIKRNQSSVKTFEDPVKHLSCLKKELKCKRKKWLYLAGGRHRNDDSDSEVRITDRMCCLSSAGHNPVRFSIGEARLPIKLWDNMASETSAECVQLVEITFNGDRSRLNTLQRNRNPLVGALEGDSADGVIQPQVTMRLLSAEKWERVATRELRTKGESVPP